MAVPPNSIIWPVGLAFAMGIDVHTALAVVTLGLVITPSDLQEVVWGGIDAHIAPE